MSKLKDSMMKSEEKLLERAFRLMEYKYLATKYKQDMKHRAVGGVDVGMVAQMNNSCEYCIYYHYDVVHIKSFCTISSKGELIRNYEDLIELNVLNPCNKFVDTETALRDFKIKEISR